MLESTGSHGRGVERRVPEMRCISIGVRPEMRHKSIMILCKCMLSYAFRNVIVKTTSVDCLV